MKREHHYSIQMKWTGNQGEGTKSYTSYSRDHEISKNKCEAIAGSSDSAFRGDPLRYNPEELFLSTLSSCHMLMYLHFCAVNKIVVEEYTDYPDGIMQENEDGSGKFTEVVLKPLIVVKDAETIDQAIYLHHEAHKSCFIANSVNFNVKVKPEIVVLK